ncbi:uncharacterized protein LOC101849668, partial [Aplysia californica]|uniref:Uncharacterized protein LOC101849668 n=1 Tax=Aplysia californica TaxID=6500 RepID=A0ABM0KBF2_APLCA
MNPGTLSPTSADIMYGEYVTITCDRPGFEPSPVFTRRRQCTYLDQEYKLDGSVQDYECDYVTCGEPPQEAGSRYTQRGGNRFGSTFVFECDTDFELTGSSEVARNSTVTCLRTGQWDFGDLSCT